MERIKQKKGITLLTLIVTVVVMLILAGVSISNLSNNGGIVNRIILATKEFKKQNLIEVVKTAGIYVEIDNQFDRTKQIDIVSLINTVKETSDINEKDYIIEVDEVEQKATIIDKKMGIVIDVWIDATGNVIVDGNIVENIEELVSPTIEYTLEPTAGTYGDEVTITIVAKEEKNGIVRTQFQNNDEKTYSNQKEVTETYTVTKNGKYTFMVEGANGRKANKHIEVNNIMSGAEIIMETHDSAPTNQAVDVEITYDENIKIGGATLINADRFQYSIGGTTWQTATENPITVPVSVNGDVYARYYDGTQGYRTVSITIANIDKEKPNAFNLSTSITTPNSITVSGNTEDTGSLGCAVGNAGISGYQFQLKNSLGEILTSWTTKQTETSYTFADLPQGEEYKVSMRAIDKAGNITEATNKDTIVVISGDDKHWDIELYARPTTVTGGQMIYKEAFEGLEPLYNIKLSDTRLSSMNNWLPYDDLMIKGATRVYCESDYTLSTTIYTDDEGSIYLNDELVVSRNSNGSTNVKLEFKKGWNTIEVYVNDSGGGECEFYFGTTLSEDANIKYLTTQGIVKPTIPENNKHWDIELYARPTTVTGGQMIYKEVFEGLEPLYNIKLSDTRLSSMNNWLPYDDLMIKGATRVYCESDYTLSTTIYTDDEGSIYLNDELVVSRNSNGSTNVKLEFKKGWNTIEVYVNDSGGGECEFYFGTTLSEDANIKYLTTQGIVKPTILENNKHWDIELYARPTTVTGGQMIYKEAFEGLEPLYNIKLSDTRLSSMNNWLPYDDLMIKGATHVYCESDYTLSTTIYTDDEGSLYLNGELLVSTDCISTNVKLEFKKGWNNIEVYVNDSGGRECEFYFGTTLSEDANITVMSCYEKTGK